MARAYTGEEEMHALIEHFCAGSRFLVGSGTRILYFNLDTAEPLSGNPATARYEANDALCCRDRLRLSSIRSERDRRRFVLQRHLLYAALSEYSGARPALPDVRLDANGKPVLPHSPVSFSISHAGAEYVIALGPAVARVGVDLDLLSKIRNPAAYSALLFRDRVFGDAETVLRAWTICEAYAKCTGIPLGSLARGDFSRFAADLASGGEPGNWAGFRFTLVRFSPASFTTLCERTVPAREGKEIYTLFC